LRRDIAVPDARRCRRRRESRRWAFIAAGRALRKRARDPSAALPPPGWRRRISATTVR